MLDIYLLANHHGLTSCLVIHIRTGSNSLMDLADAHGMLMWVENRFLQYTVQPLAQPLVGGEEERVSNPQCQTSPGSNCKGAEDESQCDRLYVPCRCVFHAL
jgi:hypothetical protein